MEYLHVEWHTLFLFHVLDLTCHTYPPGQCPLGGGGRIWKAEPDEVGFVHCWLYFLPDHTDEVPSFHFNLKWILTKGSHRPLEFKNAFFLCVRYHNNFPSCMLTYHLPLSTFVIDHRIFMLIICFWNISASHCSEELLFCYVMHGMSFMCDPFGAFQKKFLLIKCEFRFQGC